LGCILIQILDKLVKPVLDQSGVFLYNINILIQKVSKMDELQIRFDEDEGKYYVYFNGPFGSCAYQSDPFNTLEEAEAFKQDQEDSADFGEE
jgi:hypothetical protein